MIIENEYHIEPTDIQKLIEACERFDNACQECVDNRNNPEFYPTWDFGFGWEQLDNFANANPNFDYQKLLPNHTHIISPFYTELIRDQDIKRNVIRKEMARLERRYKYRYD